MTQHDPTEILRAARPAVPEANPGARAIAREAMLATPAAKTRSPRRRFIAAGAIAATAAIALTVLLAVRPFAAPNDASAAAIAQLADVAAKQPAVATAGKHEWVISRLRTTGSWTQNLTQARLDELTRNQVAIIDARNKGMGGSMVYSKKLGRLERLRQERSLKRLQDRIDARVRAGVKLSALPAHTIVATRSNGTAAYRNDKGEGGGGGERGSGDDWKIHYGSSDQAKSAHILERAQIGGSLADPSMSGGFEASLDPTYRAPRAAKIKQLSGDQATLSAQLMKLKSSPRWDDDFSDSVNLFRFAASIVGSPYASPQTRAAAIKVIADIPGVTVTQDAVDERGRHGLGFTIAIPGGTQQLVFNTADSRLLGINLQINEPKKFAPNNYFGNQRGPHVYPVFDSASLNSSYDPWIVSSTRPVCHATFCPKAITRVPNP